MDDQSQAETQGETKCHHLLFVGSEVTSLSAFLLRVHPEKEDRLNYVANSDEVISYIQELGLEEESWIIITSLYPVPGEGSKDAHGLAEDIKDALVTSMVLTYESHLDVREGSMLDGNLLKGSNEFRRVADLLDTIIDLPADVPFDDLVSLASGLITLNR